MAITGRNEPIFMLSEVAQILKMPESRIKNWTIGRPLRIEPWIVAHGKGSRNLHSAYDMYRLAIANQMSVGGATPRAIEALLAGVGGTFGYNVFAVLKGPTLGQETGLTIRVINRAGGADECWKEVLAALKDSGVCQVVRVGSVVKTVDYQIEQFLKTGSRTATAPLPHSTEAKRPPRRRRK